MKIGYFYFAIALLALYGDVIKRFVPGQVALFIVYASAVSILVAIVWHKRGKGVIEIGRDARQVKIFVFLLIFTYIIQFLSTFLIMVDAPFIEGLIHLFYMIIPLSYIIVMQKLYPLFSVKGLAHPFLILMIPINIVGIIQYLVDPSFLISTVYGGEMGGVIARNLLSEGSYSRYPSIFASADRYSAMGLMQFYFSLALLTVQAPLSRFRYIWMAFNLASSIVALGVAGARSRILIALAEVVFITTVQSISLLVRGSMRDTTILFACFSVIVLSFLLINYSSSEEYPIILFLQQSFSQGDIEARVGEAGLNSRLPDNVSLFGNGLGTMGVGGKPGEFGIYSMWMESGLIWGSLILLGFIGIIYVLIRCSLRAAFEGKTLLFAIHSLPLLILVFALLTGFTGAFELSSGILISCAIAAAVHFPMIEKGRYIPN